MSEPLRMYQGPKQEKHFRKQRQLLQREQEVLAQPDEHKQLIPVTVNKPALDIPRIVLPKSSISLIVLAYGLGTVGLGINAWFAWSRGTDIPDKVLMSSLGLITEAMAFYLPDQASRLWMQRRLIAFVFAVSVSIILFASALINGLGFASLNLAETSTVRAERITPTVSDAQRRLDTLSSSRATECLKRGDKCRQLEKDEQQALESLREARREVSVTADPQIASAAKLVVWISLDRFHPSADDFAMLRLLLLTLLPQLGGLVLMVSSTLNRK
jgi:hypothetical protein